MNIYRSVLFVPGSNARAMEKVGGLPCDAVIFDLEDAVAGHQLGAAREAINAALRQTGFRPAARFVRVNGVDTAEFANDAAALKDAPLDGVVLPKVNTNGDLDIAAKYFGETPLWPMIETPLAVLNAAQIAAHPCVAGVIIGPNDLAKEMHTKNTPDRAAIMLALQTVVLAARAYGRVCLDGIYAKFKDTEGFAAECVQGRMLGFDGKTLIHPAQIDPANAAFGPTKADIARAKAHVEGYEAAVAEGRAVAAVDGEMVEELHANQARDLLARAALIEDKS